MNIKLKEIAEFIGGNLIGDGEIIIQSVSPFNDYQEGTLTFIKESTDLCSFIPYIAIVLKDQIGQNGMNFIYVDNPRLAFFKVVKKFFVDNICENYIPYDDGAMVHKHTVMGKNIKISPNTIIGSHGFGFIKDTDGTLFEIPHIGNVVIKDNVRIGACTCIDRAAMGSTVIGKGTKIDNACHLAHGCKIGKNCIITAGVILSGSVIIGDGVWIGVGSTIKEGVKIGDRALIGSHSNVTKDVPADIVVCGNPAKFLREVREGDVHVR